MALVNKDMEIIYANKNMTSVFQFNPKKVDEKSMNVLHEIGFEGLSQTSLISTGNRIMQMPGETIELAHSSKYAYFVVMKIMIFQEKTKEDHILMVIRGERNH